MRLQVSLSAPLMKILGIYSFLRSLFLCQAYVAISFYSKEAAVMVLPGRPQTLKPITNLTLNITLLPETLGRNNFTATWTMPNGEMVSEASQSSDSRFLVQQGLVPPVRGRTLQGTTLLIQALSYSDAGMYTCSVQDNRNLGNPPIQATIELQLTLTLTGSNVTTMDNASSVELICDMSDYIRPDNQLQWFRGDQLITSGQDRRQITFRNGTRDGQLVGNLRSRESVLTISNPVLNDSGVYICRVLEITQSVDIHLLVQESTTDDIVMRSDSTTPAVINEPPLSLILGIVGLLGVVLMAIFCIVLTIVVLYVVRKRKRTLVQNAEPWYDYPEILPQVGTRGIPVVPNISYETHIHVENNSVYDYVEVSS